MQNKFFLIKLLLFFIAELIFLKFSVDLDDVAWSIVLFVFQKKYAPHANLPSRWSGSLLLMEDFVYYFMEL